MEVVLERCPCKQESVGGSELSNNFRQLGFLILDAVGLVNDEVAPVKLFECRLLSQDHFIGGYDDIPLAWHYLFTYYPFLENITPSHPHIITPSHTLTLSSAVPMRQMVMSDGHQRLNSDTQLLRVDLGAITMWGPGTSRSRTMYPSSDMVCRVLPRPWHLRGEGKTKVVKFSHNSFLQ